MPFSSSKDSSDLLQKKQRLFPSSENLDPNPVSQTRSLWELAQAQKEPHHNHMTVSTVSSDGWPSSRIVLLKEIRTAGQVFYTNYESQKGQELQQNPNISTMLYWPGLDIQVRWSGRTERLSSDDSDKYFAQRKRESQIGAWASHQSQTLENRETLESHFKAFEEKFSGQTVPRPEYWGGFLVKPSRVHILERRDHRLHDSYLYQLEGGVWSISRLSP